MLKADIILGGCFGDEGKGKLVGALSHGYDAVLRVNASTNAGHTVCDGVRTFVTRQLPSVFFPTRTDLVIAPGALLNLVALAQEVRGRPDLDQLAGKLKVASSVSLVIKPYVLKGTGAMSELIGSTHQGTGPSAVARAARHSLHLYDVQAVAAGTPGARQSVLEMIRRTCSETLPQRFGADGAEDEPYHREVLDELVGAYRVVEELVGPFAVDYSRFLVDELRGHDRRILVEGCNGMLLDNLHGAHPNVTSTPTNVGAMMCGAHLSPAEVERVLVVIAAYATCLGKRFFPTEMTPAEAEHFYSRCDEIDPAEGNRRRVGWLDLPALRKALAGAGGALLHLNKLDVLSGLPSIKLCTHYRVDGQDLHLMPDDPRVRDRAVAQYAIAAGWSERLAGLRSFSALPAEARSFVELLERLLPNRIASLGVGPANEDVIPR